MGRCLCLLFAWNLSVDARGFAIPSFRFFGFPGNQGKKNNGDKTLGEVRFCGQVAKLLNYSHIYYILVMGNSVPISIDFDFFTQFGKWIAGTSSVKNHTSFCTWMEPMSVFCVCTWRIIPCGKLISPLSRVVHFPTGHSWLLNGGDPNHLQVLGWSSK